ncbi:MAG: hypothetical protein D6805_02490 [Planctomycetota bacterium]|nr:MAG: hypothetical protein D6805_02490 [Planctomycetota bacterium]
MENYKIANRANAACSQCQKRYSNQEEYISILAHPSPDSEEFVRLSFCLECWDREKGKRRYLCFWRSCKSKVSPQSWDIQSLLETFEDLANKQFALEDEEAKFCYLLALVLLRKKRLSLQDIRFQKNQEYFVLFEKKKNKSWKIPVPPLDKEEIEHLTNKLASLLQSPETLKREGEKK